MGDIKIFNKDGFLNFVEGNLASAEDYKKADRCQGSVFEALKPGYLVELQDGIFVLNKDMDIRREVSCGDI
jgi:hypothetical protein